MSGGHFDYRQYELGYIADEIEKEIADATKKRPPKVTRHGVCIWERVRDGCYRGRSHPFEDYDQAIGFYDRSPSCKLMERYEEDGKRRSVYHDLKKDDIFEVKELIYEEYPDGGYYPEYMADTLREFRKAVKILKKAEIYVNRIDWLLSGDDGEDSFHERLKKELEEFNKKK